MVASWLSYMQKICFLVPLFRGNDGARLMRELLHHIHEVIHAPVNLSAMTKISAVFHLCSHSDSCPTSSASIDSNRLIYSG